MQKISGLTGSKLGGAAILMELGSQYGVLDALRETDQVSVGKLQKISRVNGTVLADYLDALAQAGLLRREGNSASVVYQVTAEFETVVNHVGYVAWALNACAPLLNNALAFATDNEAAQACYPREGGVVARTSQWMGATSFYPQPEDAIVRMVPSRIMDLGSGSGSLLTRLLNRVEGSSGIGIDLSGQATAQAQELARLNNLAHRLEFIHSPIQALIDNPHYLEGVEVVHAGFVLHDLLPAEEAALEGLMRAIRAQASVRAFVIVDAIPAAPDEWERTFAAAFNHLHAHFMSRRLLAEDEWREKLTAAGFRHVVIETLNHPGGRMIIASP
ncbi:methyltransferase [Pseudomonas sp. RIT-To-2]|uniref:methyltransferase n=1 Tax=Pseudomonas sp. RIT-To-2 TaxID=3462541 RepID=UPI0024130455